jgi:hypothetical protein
VIQFKAVYEFPCECEAVCDCQENELGDRVHWESEAVKPPSRGVHAEECADETCRGCWLFEIDGPTPLWWWMVENLGAQGGAVVVDGRMVDAWSGLQ